LEKEFDVVNVAVRMGGRVNGELLGDRKCDEGSDQDTVREKKL
jgi:hypothetical protein